jgi:hypothetical protein
MAANGGGVSETFTNPYQIKRPVNATRREFVSVPL